MSEEPPNDIAGPRPPRWWPQTIGATLGLLLSLQLGMGLVFLPNAPRFFNDEAFEASVGHSLAQDGRMRTAAMDGVGGMEVAFVQTRLTLPLACGATYALFDLGVATCRVTSVLMGSVLLTATVLLAHHWFGLFPAGLMGLALLLHPWFVEVSRRIRPEIYYASLGMVGVYALAIAIDRGRRVAAVAAGLAFALCGLAHPMGMIFVACIGAAALVTLGWLRVLRCVPWMLLGTCLVLVPFCLYVLAMTQSYSEVVFLEQMTAGYGQVMRWDIVRHLNNFVAGWAHFFQWPLGAPLLVIGLAALYRGIRHGQTPDRFLGLIVLFVVLAAPYANSKQISRYVFVTVAPLSILLVRLLIGLWEGSVRPNGETASGLRRSRTRQALAVAIATLYVAEGIAAPAILFHTLREADLRTVLDRISETTGSEGAVYGQMLFWLGHDRFRYVPFQFAADAETTKRALRERGAEYVVRSGWHWQSSFALTPPPSDMSQKQTGPIDEICADAATLIDSFVDPHYGLIEIYRLNGDG